jgi:hypothetical protein
MAAAVGGVSVVTFPAVNGGGLATIAEAMAAAVTGVSVVTVAVGRDTGSGLVRAEETAVPMAAAVTGVAGVRAAT